ncbi:MAG TPA: L,D-transpeptidase family protein [Nocardioides sp.]|nr:L,D-transpeptidase family protein [Nocardioides sp.]
MNRLLMLVVTLALLAPLEPAAPAAVATAPSEVRLDGVDVRLRDGTTQVVTVNRTRGYRARVTWWVHRDGRWEERLQATDGRIGYGGLVLGKRRRQGTGTTPIGTYDLPWAFGTHRADPGWDLRYRKIRRGDFWVQDNASDYYNRYRNQRQGGFRWRLPASDPNSSERLTDYPVQYEWSIVTSFNSGQVRHRGSGIFLHVNGSGATAGCVSAPRWFIKALMGRLDPDRRPVIAIGR